MILSAHEMAWLAIGAGFRPGRVLADADSEAETFVAVCIAESGLNTDIIGAPSAMKKPDGTPNPAGGQRDHGLAQLSGYWHWDLIRAHGGNWRDPKVNTAIAYRIFVNAGRQFTPWNAFKTLDHVPFLPIARIAVARSWPLVDPYAELANRLDIAVTKKG